MRRIRHKGDWINYDYFSFFCNLNYVLLWCIQKLIGLCSRGNYKQEKTVCLYLGMKYEQVVFGPE